MPNQENLAQIFRTPDLDTAVAIALIVLAGLLIAVAPHACCPGSPTARARASGGCGCWRWCRCCAC